MFAIRNILVLYHRNVGDEAALERAASLARNVSGSIIVSEILDPALAGPLSWFLPPSPRVQRAWARVVSEREAHFERLVQGIRYSNVPVRCKMLADGSAYESVLRAVIEEDVDLVMISSADAALSGNAPQRNLASRLMWNCPCPVWVIGSGEAGELRRLTAAVSLPDDPDGDHGSAERVLGLARALSSIERCRVDVLHAWDFTGRDRVRARSEIPASTLAQMVRSGAAVHRARIGTLIAALPPFPVPVHIHAHRGLPNEIIPEFVARNRVDLVVMGSAARPSLMRLLIGNMVEEVAEDVDCSVLAVGTQAPDVLHPHPLA